MNTSTKKLLALILSAVMLLGLLAGCGNTTAKPAETKNPGPQVPILSGMLVLTASASFKIGYDQDGMVMEVSGGNEAGIELAAAYTDYIGKSCATAVKELLDATAGATLLREAKSVVLKLAVGSQLPSETFLDGLAKDAADAVAANSCTASVVAISLEELDEDGYINAQVAQNLLKNELGVTEFETYNGDTTPRNDCYTVYVKSGEAEGAYLIDAVTGIITEAMNEDSADQDYQEYVDEEETFDPSFEEQVEETISDSAIEEDIPVEETISDSVIEEDIPVEDPAV